MKRFRPDQVWVAYNASGLVPIQEEFVAFDDKDRICGCGLTALCCDIDPNNFNVIDAAEDKEIAAANILDCDSDYASGFVYGFDWGTTPECKGLAKNMELFRIGYVDGIQAADLMFDEHHEIEPKYLELAALAPNQPAD